MKKRIYYICMAICLSFVTLSCEDSFEDLDGEFHATESKHSSLPLKLKSTIWAIDGSGGSYRCTIEADKNVHWQITGLPSWLKFSRTSGIGSTVLTYSVERNPSASTVRTANLTLESTSKDKPSSTTYQVCQYIQSKDFAVDLGLSVKWASCNVGATKPEEFGGYYAWGEIEEKSIYNWSNYKLCNGNSYSSINKYTSQYDILDPEDDVAHETWGVNWRMPTRDEMYELKYKCTWKWTTLNGVTGAVITGPNKNSIFLPAAGSFGHSYGYDSSFGSYGTTPSSASEECCYWSSENYEDGLGLYFSLRNSKYNPQINTGYRNIGLSIRPVTK